MARLKNQKMAVKIYKSVFCKCSAVILHTTVYAHSGKRMKTKENLENKTLLQVWKRLVAFLGVVLYHSSRARESWTLRLWPQCVTGTGYRNQGHISEKRWFFFYYRFWLCKTKAESCMQPDRWNHCRENTDSCVVPALPNLR